MPRAVVGTLYPGWGVTCSVLVTGSSRGQSTAGGLADRIGDQSHAVALVSALARVTVQQTEAVQQDLVVMGEVGCCAPEPFEDVRGRADRHDADLPGLSQNGDDCVFGGLPVVGDQAAGAHLPRGKG